MKEMLCVMVFCSLVAFCSHAQNGEGINFQGGLSTWEAVKQKASAENKSIFMDVYATWCGPCKMMDGQVYSDSTVGGIMNDKFISVKVQMDSTSNDNLSVKQWYAESKKIGAEYNIAALPALLFFTPKGDLVEKQIGFQSAGAFLNMAREALDPSAAYLYAAFNNYKAGVKDYANMGRLAYYTLHVVEDKQLANEIAVDYKIHYLDLMPTDSLCSKKYLDFIDGFRSAIDIKDSFFKLSYDEPNRVDSLKVKGWSRSVVDYVVYEYEIEKKVLINGKAEYKYPEWKKIEKNIALNYPAVDHHRLVLDYECNYYRRLYVDWQLWARAKDKLIQDYPPSPKHGLDAYIGLNVSGAWDVFLHCMEPKVLRMGLKWIDLAIKLDGESPAYLDTKANLLYKLGKTHQAITIEKTAAALNKGKDKEIVAAFNKMQKGLPTWLVKN